MFWYHYYIRKFNKFIKRLELYTFMKEGDCEECSD